MDLFDVVIILRGVLNAIIPILIGLAVLLFIYGLLQYIISKDQQTRREAINIIVYGIVSIFIMISIWAIVQIVADTLGVRTGGWIGSNSVPTEHLIRK